MFDYIYGDGTKHFNFIRLPQILFTDENFSTLSSDAKILYALLLDRTSLSIKSNWFESDGRVYINFPLAEICQKIGVGMQKAGKLMRELENFGLIERKRLGQGYPDKIYVKHCTRQDENADDEPKENVDVESVENSENFISESGNSSIQNDENHHSRDVKITSPDISESSFSLYNHTKKTRLSESDLIHPSSETIDGSMDSRTKKHKENSENRRIYEEIIKENIEYNWFSKIYRSDCENKPQGSIEELDELVSIMVDCVCSTAPSIRVNGSYVPTEIVKNVFLKLNCEHIQYVFERISDYAAEVVNVRAYLITVLYNAAQTMNHSMGIEFRSEFGDVY